MNYQRTSGFQSEAPESENNGLKATLQRLHVALDPHNPAADIHHARTIVDSLIDLTQEGAALANEPAEVAWVGRKQLILQALVRNAGKICSKRELADLCHVSAKSTRVIKVYICQIRAALAPHGLADAIETVWGVGYLIQPSDARKIRSLIRQQTAAASALPSAGNGSANSYN